MTQSELLRRVDLQARRALASREKGDVSAMMGLYADAIDEIALQVAGAWEELGQAEDAGRRQFLHWKIDQEERLMGSIQRRLDQLRDDLTGSLSDAMVTAYEDQFFRQAYALDQATPPSVVLDLAGGNPTEVDAILSTPWKRGLFSDRIWSITDDMANEIRNEIAASIARGESVAQAKRRIKNLDVLGQNVPADYAIERLVRTEIAKAQDRAVHRFNLDNDDVVDDEISLATIEKDRTCEGCADLDLKSLDSDEAREIRDDWDFEDRPPYHPNCRCRVQAVPKRWGLLLSIGKVDVPDDLARFSDEERVVRDPLTGKSKLVPFVSFGDWAAQHGLVPVPR